MKESDTRFQLIRLPVLHVFLDGMVRRVGNWDSAGKRIPWACESERTVLLCWSGVRLPDQGFGGHKIVALMRSTP